jgi:hypothetical protein
MTVICEVFRLAAGQKVAGGVTLAPIHFQNGPLTHIPLVGEPEDEPKAD